MTALRKLLDAVEAGTATRTEIENWCASVWPCSEGCWKPVAIAMAFNGSLDAVKLMREVMLPKCRTYSYIGNTYTARITTPNNETVSAHSESLPRAWLIAILMALVAMEGE